MVFRIYYLQSKWVCLVGVIEPVDEPSSGVGEDMKRLLAGSSFCCQCASAIVH